MRKRSISVVVFAGAFAILTGLAIGARNHGPMNANHSADANAAFRDGMYQARLAVERGERPHLTAGRWSRDLDRRAYVAGYQQAYSEALGSDGITVPAGVEQAGYRDGLEAGSQDRQSAQFFQNVARLNERGTISQSNAYREGFTTGYQLAYYGNQDVQNAMVIRPVASRVY